MVRMKHRTTVFYLIPGVALRPEMVVILAFSGVKWPIPAIEDSHFTGKYQGSNFGSNFNFGPRAARP